MIIQDSNNQIIILLTIYILFNLTLLNCQDNMLNSREPQGNPNYDIANEEIVKSIADIEFSMPFRTGYHNNDINLSELELEELLDLYFLSDTIWNEAITEIRSRDNIQNNYERISLYIDNNYNEQGYQVPVDGMELMFNNNRNNSIDRLFNALIKEDVQFYNILIYWLQSLDPVSDYEYIESLVNMLGSYPEFSERIIDVLEAYPSVSIAYSAILDCINDDLKPKRIAAIHSLGFMAFYDDSFICSEELTEKLIVVTKSDDVDERSAAYFAMRFHENCPIITQTIWDMYNEGGSESEWTIITTLYHIGDSGAVVPVLVNKLKQENLDDDLKVLVIQLLGNMGSDAISAIPELEKFLLPECNNPMLVTSAVEAITEIKGLAP